MVEASRAFHWVTVDRDRTPEIPKRFHVSAYPSVLVLGKEDENVHRTQGFCGKEEFRERLAEALRRWRLYLDGKEWDALEPGPARITDAVEVETLPAPSDAVPAGIVAFGGDLLVGQGGTLYRLDPAKGTVKGSFPVDPSIMDLATDGKSLWAVPSGWTAGRPILVLDPETGRTLREVVTEENRKNRAHGAKGIAWHDGRLLVLEGMEGRIREVDPGSGAIRRTIQTPGRWLTGLASDGTHLLAGSRDHLLRIDPETGEIAGRVPVNSPLRSVGVLGGATYLMEQPIFGFGRRHERIQVRPRPGETRIHRVK